LATPSFRRNVSLVAARTLIQAANADRRLIPNSWERRLRWQASPAADRIAGRAMVWPPGAAASPAPFSPLLIGFLRRYGLLRTLLLLFALVGAICCFCCLPRETCADNLSATVPAAGWVRTSVGWEQADDWFSKPPSAPPSLHPFVVAAGQVLGSLLALLACSDGRGSLSMFSHRFAAE
jgi:hypothetical protein